MLISDKAYLPALLRLLDRARERVDLLAFSFPIASAGGKLAHGSAPLAVAEKLIELRKRGVKVRVYLEGERETAWRNSITARHLRRYGVLSKLGATHAKGVCVDGKELLLGSTNLSNTSLTKNRETNLLLDDETAAREFGRYFLYLWRGGRHGGIRLAPPLLADQTFLPALLEMIRGAKRTLEFSIYFFHQKDIENALLDAHRRGVKISGLVHQHFAFALSYVRRTQATVRRLEIGGITGLRFAPGNIFTHSKYLIRDRREIALGTGNWLDEDVHVHPQLYLRLEDPVLARRLSRKLQTQLKAADREQEKGKRAA